MNELVEKVQLLKEELDKSFYINRISILQNNISSNKELIEKIKKYKIYPNDNLKLEIYKDKDFYEYKQIENEVNILIMKINMKLKKIVNSKRGCSNENN